MSEKPMMEKSQSQELQRRNRELSILNSIAQALNRENDLDRALQTILAQVADLFDLHTGWIFLVHPETQVTYLAAAYHLPPGLASQPNRMSGSCYCLDTYHDGDMDGAANVNIITCTRLSRLVSGSDGLRFHASIPLYGPDEQKLGVLNVASPDWNQLSDDDLRLLYTVGDLLSIAIVRAHLFARSAQMGAVEERNRLAREIHDTLAQGLSAITLHLETADELLAGAPADLEPIHTFVRQALTLARTSLDEARRSVLDLRAAPLEGRTLAQGLAALCSDSPLAKQIHGTFTLHGDDRPLPVHLEAGLYRIAQEALTNVAQHAQATRTDTTLTIVPDRVILVVDDNGQGFDPSDVPENRFGLVGLTERVKLLGGTLDVESYPGVGTKVKVTIPLS